MTTAEVDFFHYFLWNTISHSLQPSVFCLKYGVWLGLNLLMSLHPTSQAIEKSTPLTRSPLAKSVSNAHAWDNDNVSLHAANNERKYLNRDERRRAIRAMRRLEPVRALYAQLLAWTGARPTEIMKLSANSFDIETGLVNIVTLKRRSHSVRGVPIPPDLMGALVRHFDLRRVQQDPAKAGRRLFTWGRTTAWRIIKQVMAWAYISGIKACPKGFRHSFGVCTLQSGVPLTLVRRWMGHARLSTTAIYLNVSGPDELVFARWFWKGARKPPPVAFNYAMAA